MPIIPDEARTFGMDAYFPTAKIYNPNGQHYTSVDRELLLAYKESPQGQIIHVGINEAGAFAAFTAAGTAYATHGEPLIPVYVFYSMFGFQRTGDAMWAAGDQMARGFIIGATAGRTTLTGEGLQHADGHSHLLASTNPAVVAYDPAYGYEIGHIVRDGLERMYGGQTPSADPNVMYYITVYNEPIVQPAEPEGLDVEGVLRGIYKLSAAQNLGPKAQLMASGVAVPWALEAQQLLAQDWNVAADVWSVTSWNELRRDGLAADEHNFLHPTEPPQIPYLWSKLAGSEGPYVAVSDYMHAVRRPGAPVRARRLRDARRRRLRLQRHPCRRPPLLQDRRPVDRGAHAAVARAPRRGRPERDPAGDREVPPARRDGRHHRHPPAASPRRPRHPHGYPHEGADARLAAHAHG